MSILPLTPAPIPDEGLEVAKSAIKLRFKAQLRIGLAGFAGMLVGKHILPSGLVDDTLLDALTSIVFAAVAVYWQDARAWLQHQRLWDLATNPKVPPEIIRPVTPPETPTEPQP